MDLAEGREIPTPLARKPQRTMKMVEAFVNRCHGRAIRLFRARINPACRAGRSRGTMSSICRPPGISIFIEMRNQASSIS